MHTLDLALNPDKPATFLFLGAHCDDIEIGCGGTVLRLAEQYPKLRFVWVIFSSDATRATEAQRSFTTFLQHTKAKLLRIEEFRNGYFPFVGAEIKDYFEELKKTENPSVIFTHYRQDLHQDHRLISELTWNTFRDHLVLEYEIPKYDGDLGSPNFFVPLSQEIGERKVRYILECFESQQGRYWFKQETFLALMRLRAIECNARNDFAEAYYCRKFMI